MSTLFGVIKQLERLFAPTKRQLKLYKELMEPIALQVIDNPELLERTISFDLLQSTEWLEKILTPTPFRTTQFLLDLENTIKDMEQSWDDLSDKVKKALLFLAERGWFFPIFNKQIIKLLGFHEHALEGDLNKLDRDMSAFFENRLDSIQMDLLRIYPHREHLIKAGMKAHKSGKYELAILMFFSQVDGFCWDAANCNYFRKKNKKPQISAHVENVVSRRFAEAMLSALTTNLPVSYGEWERKKATKPYTGPNRHTIMHGESLDYGTKENSFKALSLLYYVALALEFAGMSNSAQI